MLRIALCEYAVYPYREALEALHLACGPSHGAKSSWWRLLGTSAPVKPAAKIDHLYDDDLGAPAPAYLCTGSTLKEAQLISSASVAQGLDTGRRMGATWWPSLLLVSAPSAVPLGSSSTSSGCSGMSQRQRESDAARAEVLRALLRAGLTPDLAAVTQRYQYLVPIWDGWGTVVLLHLFNHLVNRCLVPSRKQGRQPAAPLPHEWRVACGPGSPARWPAPKLSTISAAKPAGDYAHEA